jgi:photosystem II PsbZ protein
VTDPGLVLLEILLYWERTMTIVFDLFLGALVLFSFAMIVAVPVLYASPQNFDQSKKLLYLGSGVWAILVVVVGVLNFLVA